MLPQAAAIRAVAEWYGNLAVFQDGLPSKGTIAAALVVLERLRISFDLDIVNHVAGGQAQITGLSGASLRRILAEFGETRVLSSVGGRSNRGARGDISSLLDRLCALRLDRLGDASRDEVLEEVQRYIVTNYVSLYFSIKRVKATFDGSTTTRKMIGRILDDARKNGKAGPVAQYLVGAKLALLYPTESIVNERSSAGDVQTGRRGDFEFGSTVFHVTVAPMPELFEKCNSNLEDGCRVYLLVPDKQLEGARQNAELLTGGRVAVESIESFVATNVDELASFDGEKLVSGFRRLLDKYNERVEAVEVDKSMLIEIPTNLA